MRETTGSNNLAGLHSDVTTELFDWSWCNEPLSDHGAGIHDQSETVERPLIQVAPKNAGERRGRWSKNWTRSLDLVPYGIESFPPLLARMSTEQWQTPSAVDLTEPNLDQPVLQTFHRDKADQAVAGELHDEAIDDLITERTTEQQWMRKSGKIGSASHVRRSTTFPDKRRPYSSMVDLTLFLRKKAFRNKHSLTEHSLSAETDEADSASVSKNRSGLSSSQSDCGMKGREQFGVPMPTYSIAPHQGDNGLQYLASTMDASCTVRSVEVLPQGDDGPVSCKACDGYGRATSVDWIG